MYIYAIFMNIYTNKYNDLIKLCEYLLNPLKIRLVKARSAQGLDTAVLPAGWYHPPAIRRVKARVRLKP